ncbi:hypothetical protein EON83_20395 [bacterium]|nr:MAG: hypothetical protein EON83_20395 [bacterium]
MPRSPLSTGDSSQTYKPELPDSAPDRIAVNMTVGDRRVLESKAKSARKSATQWIISCINGELEGNSKSLEGDKKPSSLHIFFGLDRRRRALADETAKKLGFLATDDLAKDLLHRAIEDPELAEEFLFGKLRARLQSDSTNQKKAA